MARATTTADDLLARRGDPVIGADGEKIGDMEDFFVDAGSNEPEWIAVSAGFLGMSTKLVPLEGAHIGDDGIHVAYPKDVVKDAPSADGDEIGADRERELYEHYGVAQPTPAPTEGRAAPRPEPDEADLTRSEEELAVGKRDVAAGHVRLRKWVETEPAEAEVTTRRETAHVTREDVDRPASPDAIGEEEVDVPLRAEEPVAEKRTVARERIGIEKDVEHEDQTVRDELRKERIDVDEETR